MNAPRPQLRPHQRIKRGRDFQRARTEGQRIVLGCLIFNWLESAPGQATRVGIITTRRLGGSVVRSRARRLLREAFRLNRHTLSRAVDVVLIARNSIVEKDFAGVESDLRAAAKRARLLNESGSTTAHP